MTRRDFLIGSAAFAALVALGAPAGAQGVDVSAIDAYLRGLRSATGRFRQTNPGGSVQTGTFHLAKPGRVRFEYDAPPGAMVIADGINVAVFDPKSTRVSSRYPLGTTPLQLLLRDDLSLREPGMVQGATREGGVVRITAVDPRAPREGRIVLSFAEDPVALTGWVLTTKAGQRTAVELSELRTGVAQDRGLFNIEREEIRRR